MPPLIWRSGRRCPTRSALLLPVAGAAIRSPGALSFCRRFRFRTVRLGMRQLGRARPIGFRHRLNDRLVASSRHGPSLVGRPGLRMRGPAAVARFHHPYDVTSRFVPGHRPRARCRGRRRGGRGRSGFDRAGDGKRGGLLQDRAALVAEVIRRGSGRVEVLRPGRRLGSTNCRSGSGDSGYQAGGDDPIAELHRLPSFQSAKLMRSIRKRSLVRAYQPRPCMRPISRILSVWT